MEALGDELLGDHDGGGGDVAAGAGERRHEEGWEVGAEQRLGELARAEVDGGGGRGAEDDGGEAAVEPQGPVGSEDVEEHLPRPPRGGAGLDAGLDGVDGEQSGVGEGPAAAPAHAPMAARASGWEAPWRRRQPTQARARGWREMRRRRRGQATTRRREAAGAGGGAR